MGERNPDYIAKAQKQAAAVAEAVATAALAEEKRNENLINFIALGSQFVSIQSRKEAVKVLTERLGLSTN